jgi:hypothetical protein
MDRSVEHHIGVLMAAMNSSIVLIALPDIFRGIGMDPCSRRTLPTSSGCSWATCW